MAIDFKCECVCVCVRACVCMQLYFCRLCVKKVELIVILNNSYNKEEIYKVLNGINVNQYILPEVSCL